MTPAEARAWEGGAGRIATRDVPAAVLALVDERQGGRFCRECRHHKIETPADEPLELDHIRPLSRGGKTKWNNMQWLCRGHNRGKGARTTAPTRPPHARGPR